MKWNIVFEVILEAECEGNLRLWTLYLIGRKKRNFFDEELICNEYRDYSVRKQQKIVIDCLGFDEKIEWVYCRYKRDSNHLERWIIR